MSLPFLPFAFLPERNREGRHRVFRLPFFAFLSRVFVRQIITEFNDPSRVDYHLFLPQSFVRESSGMLRGRMLRLESLFFCAISPIMRSVKS